MIELEANLSVDLGGEPCLTARTVAGRLVVSFVSPAAFRRAVKAARQAAVPSGSPSLLPPVIRDALLSQRLGLRVGEEEVAEIVPGEPTSLAARLAGLDIPGLRVRGMRLARLLLGGD
jgi:hypothetical protein